VRVTVREIGLELRARFWLKITVRVRVRVMVRVRVRITFRG
jgi:hypothetical protein